MGIRSGVASIAAMMVLGTTGQALAATVDEQFARICLGPAGDATAKARAEGYMKAPAEISDKVRGFPTNGDLLWRTGEGEMFLFASAALTREMPGSSQAVSGQVCIIASMPAQPDLKAAAERMLGVGDLQPVGKSTGYVFEETESGRVRLDASDKPLMGVKTLQGSVRIVGVMERPGMSGLMLMAPSIGPK